mmetsp:Transcript_16653/g.53149  ORF Transcript_16653/g.53149 Transcript_16653/m.53149 type:complete len:211 (-) Transcript_16653:785-1417(-)
MLSPCCTVYVQSRLSTPMCSGESKPAARNSRSSAAKLSGHMPTLTWRTTRCRSSTTDSTRSRRSASLANTASLRAHVVSVTSRNCSRLRTITRLSSRSCSASASEPSACTSARCSSATRCSCWFRACSSAPCWRARSSWGASNERFMARAEASAFTCVSSSDPCTSSSSLCSSDTVSRVSTNLRQEPSGSCTSASGCGRPDRSDTGGSLR